MRRARVQQRTTNWWNVKAGSLLHEHIQLQFKSVAEFAVQQAGVDVKTLRNWIRGETIPQPAKLREVCKQLGLDPHLLRDAAREASVSRTPTPTIPIAPFMRGLGYTLDDIGQVTSAIEGAMCSGTDIFGPNPLLVGYVLSGELTVAHVNAFVDAMRGRKAASGLLTCHSRISAAAVEAAHATRLGLTIRTLSELVDSVANFRPLLESYVAAYEDSDESSHYVDISAYRPIYDRRGRVRGQDFHNSVEHYIELWLSEESRNQIAILGDFGSGKTWLAQKLAYEYAKCNLRDRSTHRIPVYVPLAAFSGMRNLEALITTRLARAGVQLAADFLSFDALNRAGRLVLILDGFEQMGRNSDSDTMQAHFAEIERLVVPRSKIILTCRTAYFRTDLEHLSLLAPEAAADMLDAGSVRLALRDKANFETVYLAPFQPQHIKAALRKRLGRRWHGAYNRIRTTYDLPNLARRPMLLSMIVEVLPFVAEKSNVSPAVLYSTYVQRWLSLSAGESLTPNALRLSFMKAVAAALYEDHDAAIPASRFPAEVREHFNITSREDVEHFAHDMRFHALLVRDDSGNYFFAHRSFMEYFVATQCVEEIAANSPALLERTRLTPEVASFMRDLLTDAHRESLWRLIMGAHIHTASLWSGGNAATLLNLTGADFRGRRLPGRRLRGAYLARAVLDNAVFAKCDLRASNFNYSSLRRCDMRGADLTDISIEERGGIRALAFTRHALLAGLWSGKIVAYDTRRGTKPVEVADRQESIRALAISPSGRIIAAVDYSGGVSFWGLSSALEDFTDVRPDIRNARSISWSRDGKLIAVGLADGDIVIWSAAQQVQEARITAHHAAVSSLMFSPVTAHLLSGAYDGSIRVFACSNWSQSDGWDGGTNEIRSVCYSGDGKYVLAAGSDGIIRIWSSNAGDLLTELRGHAGPVQALECHPTMPLCASASYDRTARLWDLTNFREVHVLGGHTDYLSSVTFNPSGSELATTGLDGTIRTWSVSSGAVKRVIKSGKKERLTCAGLQLKGAVGLTEAQWRYLRARGARL